ncbi:hypothetical protein [Amaricoccus tamworthensis]|uniref:hypothetical protein n=1 Tax=Amaricoccus tamworthensis TaxID=57002 RepID=UPI003C7B1EFD
MGDLLDGQIATALGGKSTEEPNLLARLAKERRIFETFFFESFAGVIADIDRKIEEHTVHGWETHPAWDENGNESFMDVPASEMLPEAEALAIASQPLREMRDFIARIHDLRAASTAVAALG